MNASVLESNPEMGTFFEHMSRLPLEKITPFVPEGGAGIGMHVIPVEKAIELENESVDLEHISHWLSKLRGKIRGKPLLLPPVPPYPWRGLRGTIRRAGVSQWAIWRIMWWKPRRTDAILPARKRWRF